MSSNPWDLKSEKEKLKKLKIESKQWNALHKAIYEEKMSRTLLCALWDEDFKLFCLLLSKPDIDLEERDEDGSTPLLHACRYGLASQAKLLIEHGCKLDVKDKHDWTPLSICCANFHHEIALLLLKNGCTVDLHNEPQDPLNVSLLRHNGRMYLVLLKYLNCDQATRCEYLMTACRYGCVRFVSEFLKCYNPNYKDSQGVSPLSWACFSRNEKIVCMLIENGIGVGVNRDHYTPSRQVVLPIFNPKTPDTIFSLALHRGYAEVFYSLLMYEDRDEVIRNIKDLQIPQKFVDFVSKRNEETMKIMMVILCAKKLDKGSYWYCFPTDLIKLIFDLSMLKTVNLGQGFTYSKVKRYLGYVSKWVFGK